MHSDPTSTSGGQSSFRNKHHPKSAKHAGQTLYFRTFCVFLYFQCVDARGAADKEHYTATLKFNFSRKRCQIKTRVSCVFRSEIKRSCKAILKKSILIGEHTKQRHASAPFFGLNSAEKEKNERREKYIASDCARLFKHRFLSF